MGGSVSFGYSQSSSGDNSAQSLTFGTSGNLYGYYHDPRFLQFSVNPTYQWNRAGSSGLVPFSNGTEGISALVQFLTNSSMPISFQVSVYRSGSAAVAGPVEVGSTGLNRNFSLSWALRRKHLPGLTINYNWGSSNNSITGAQAPELTSSHSGGSIMATHKLLGFNLNASYGFTKSQQVTPDVLDLGLPQNSGKSHGNSANFGIGRSLPLSSELNINASRTDSDYTIFGSPQNQHFDTVTATLTSRPLKRLAVSFGANYSSDTLAELVWQLFVPSGSNLIYAVPQQVVIGGRTFGYSVGAGYNVGHGLSVSGSMSHGASHLPGQWEIASDAYTGSLWYARRFKGGILSMGYGPSYQIVHFSVASVPLGESHSVGHAGSVSYLRRLGRFATTSSFRYTQNTAVLAMGTPLVVRSFGGNFRVGTRMWNRWNLSFGGNLAKSQVPDQNGSTSASFNGTLSNRTWSFSATEQISSSYMLLTTGGLTSVATPAGEAVPSLPSLYTNSSGLALGASYNRRKLTLSSSYTRASAQMDAAKGPVSSANTSLEFRATYKLRLIDVRGGYRRWTQMATSNGNLNTASRTIWFDIVRPFRLF